MTPNEELIMLKAFLDLIKPSYSTYLMAGNVLFEDSAAARDVGFCGTETWFMPFDHANRFISHDDWHYPNLDSGERTFDSGPSVECMQLTNIFPEYTLYDAVHPIVTLDDTSVRILDDGSSMDSDSVDTLMLQHIYPEYTLYDSIRPEGAFDGIASGTMDSNGTLDNDELIETLEITQV